MIRFALACENGHGFDGWFRDNVTFDQQRRRGFVTCPACNSAKVDKAIMAPHVARSNRAGSDGEAETPRSPQPGGGTGSAVSEAATSLASLSSQDKALRDLARAVREHVERTADHVGDRFADEALAMHLGEVEERAIYGSATADEARALLEEGVPFMPLPALPDHKQ